MGVRAATSLREISHGVALQQTDAQAVRIERGLREGRLLRVGSAMRGEPVRMGETKESERNGGDVWTLHAGPCENLDGARFVSFHQPHPEIARDHHSAQALN